ncbi:hypothetical protein [Rheinheimera sp.]|jgi:hypothetical protein|uniref:hypothetical protein n=1 Tax=Rheinheimera sp. TaxID=1869214 RepID=UPI00260516F2|nr:hypothetical protein [Rheinheimera sp.]MCA1930596.1 hypothetical protein [Rheinheimera sp.]
MKSIKFVAIAAVLVATSFASGKAPAVDSGVKQEIAGVCPAWPICRDVDFVEQNSTPDASNVVIKKAA